MERELKGVDYSEAEIPVLFLEEGDKIVAYCPALDLSSCGKDRPEAEKRIGEAVYIFLEELVEMGTLDAVLEELGWRKSPHEHLWSPPALKGYIQEKVKIPKFT